MNMYRCRETFHACTFAHCSPACSKRDNKTIIYARSPKTDPALWPMVLEKAIAAFQWRKSHRATKDTTAVAKGDVYAYIDAKLPDSNFNKCCQVHYQGIRV